MLVRAYLILFLIISCCSIAHAQKTNLPKGKSISVIITGQEQPRILFGAEQLIRELRSVGYAVKKNY